MVHQASFAVGTKGPGLHDITAQVERAVGAAGITIGIATVFCAHTSCSLVLMENASPAARRDLERYLDRLVPAGDYEHDEEGPDDMPSHIKMALTRTSEVIPVAAGRLALGTWQGIYLWEHRATAHRRMLIVTVLGE